MDNKLCTGHTIGKRFVSLIPAKEACEKTSGCGCIADGPHRSTYRICEGRGYKHAIGTAWILRPTTTKGIHSNILIYQSYKSDKAVIEIRLIFIIIISRMDQNDEQILLRRSHQYI